ncbi:MAG TPA: O-antigen ligase family protein [Thermodesulfovibrionales bacterium]|nr:O-antigen ligase family protein [Thermodesulfovibrionales bacterium]
MKYIRYGLLCVLFSAPLMFGTVEPWSLAVMETALFGLFFLWFLRTLRSGQPNVSFIRPPFLVPIGLLFFFAVLQVVPLPLFILKTVAPQTYKLYQDIAVNNGIVPWRTLSLYPHASVLEIVRFLSCICVYVLTLQVARSKASLDVMIIGIFITGICVALIGIFQFGSPHKKLLWFREMQYGYLSFGPYVNRNHFAGLMEMLIPVGIGMCIYLFPSVQNQHGRRALLSEFLTHTHANRLLLFFSGVIIMITGLFLSFSRGGIIGFCLAMVFFGTMLLLRKSTRRKGWIIVITFFIVLLSVSWFGWTPIVKRFAEISQADTSAVNRIHNWKDSAAIIRSYPFFGTGLGTYEYVYPRYKTILSPDKWEHAHNDYIEGAVELGIPGLLIGIYIIVGFYVMMFRVIGQRSSMYCRLLGIGGMAGLTGILIHNFVDFNLHIGANALFFSFLCAFTIAVTHANSGNDERGTLLVRKDLHIPLKMRRVYVASVMVFSLAVSAVSVLPALAELYYNYAAGPLKESPSFLMTKRSALESGSRLSPLDARFFFAIGNIDTALQRNGDAIADYSKAVSLNPVNSEYLLMLGGAYVRSGEGVKAGQYLRLAVLYDPLSFRARKDYASWLISQGRTGEGTAEMRKAISLDPGITNIKNCIAAMVINGLPPERTRDGIPDNPLALMLHGEYRERIGDNEGALQSYLDALSAMKRNGRLKSDVYYKIAGIHERRGQLEKAMATYEDGVNELPSDINLGMNLAKIYDTLKIYQKAKEQYEKIFTLDPSNKYAEKRLSDLAVRQ